LIFRELRITGTQLLVPSGSSFLARNHCWETGWSAAEERTSEIAIPKSINPEAIVGFDGRP